MITEYNGKQFGCINAGGKNMQFNFAELISHAAKTRPLLSNTLIGSGTISSYNVEDGFGCIMEQRAVYPDNAVPYMKKGDRIRIYVEDFDDLLYINQQVR